MFINLKVMKSVEMLPHKCIGNNRSLKRNFKIPSYCIMHNMNMLLTNSNIIKQP